MDLDRLTIEAQAALQEAQQQATARHHQQLEPEHLQCALRGELLDAKPKVHAEAPSTG